MLRRPPSAIPIRQSDVAELEQLLIEQRETTAQTATTADNNDDRNDQAKGKGQGKERAAGTDETGQDQLNAQQQEKLQRERRIGIA